MISAFFVAEVARLPSSYTEVWRLPLLALFHLTSPGFENVSVAGCGFELGWSGFVGRSITQFELVPGKFVDAVLLGSLVAARGDFKCDPFGAGSWIECKIGLGNQHDIRLCRVCPIDKIEKVFGLVVNASRLLHLIGIHLRLTLKLALKRLPVTLERCEIVGRFRIGCDAQTQC